MKVEFIHFDKIDSTNNWGKNNAHILPKDKITIITAEEQTAGRGRFQKRWFSTPAENICATFCFFVEEKFEPIGNIPQVLAISTVQTLEALGVYSKLKWPNDILVSGKKIAGILCEAISVENQVCVVLGIGINVNMSIEILKTIDQSATSLKVEMGSVFDVNELFLQLQHCFVQQLQRFFQEGFIPFLSLYRRRFNLLPGDRLSIFDNRLHWEGNFHSISEDGSIRLRLPSGEFKNIYSGVLM